VEPEAYLRGLARDEAARQAVAIEVVEGVADRLPAADESFDAAVTSLVLCSVPDQPRALAELRRVIRPGGELRFYEHVRADSPGFARLQAGLDRVLWPRIGGGCHTARDTSAAITAAGFEIERSRAFSFRPSVFVAPVSPHVLGLARRP
jgi:ubiquinone/menaquinone biosynthesis C-methylase UbiE